MRRTPSGCGLPAAIAADLESAGLNLAGVLSVARFDELVPAAWRSGRLLPGARSVVVLGCGGRAFEAALEASNELSAARDPVDDFVRLRVEEVARRLHVGGHPSRALFDWQSSPNRDATERADGAASGFADFVALARDAGLGETGRLRMLLSPRYGPWMAIRAILLTVLELEPSPPPPHASPCLDCVAPCVSACPGDALGAGVLDPILCLQTRERVSACETSCAARRACVIGPADAYSQRFEAHFMRSSLTIAKELKRKAQLEA